PMQYADYSLWQRGQFSGPEMDIHLDYWKNHLKGVVPLDLPTDYLRPSVQSNIGGVVDYCLDASVSDGFQALGREQGATLFMTLLSAFDILMYRYSGQSDICVGSPVLGRTDQALEPLIGFFVNTVALRIDLKGNPSYLSVLAQVKDTTLEGYSHQSTPFEQVVDAVVTDRDSGRSPLFQVFFTLQDLSQEQRLRIDNVVVSPLDVTHTTSRFEIGFTVIERASGIHLSVNYNSDFYSRSRIERMAIHYEELLRSILLDPGSGIDTLNILPGPEVSELFSFNPPVSDDVSGSTLLDLFHDS
ncbi:condensation domain-containing protein, partial [Pedobacter jeongneungensis]|uniref:condensation domain-containing protein n=1 Tax=Pedobacter jeongneungensis TaxID=947309 RepID=UPI0031EDB919